MRHVASRFTVSVCFVVSCCISPSVVASETKVVGILGWDGGGGKQLYLSNNDSVSASRSFSLRLGIELPSDVTRPFATQLTVGFKDSSMFGIEGLTEVLFPIDDDYARFTRYPVELLGLYRLNEKFRAGIGITYHLAPKLSCEEIRQGACGGTPSVNFDDALGGVIQCERVGETFTLGIRYTFIDYKAGGNRFDGSSAGVFMGVKL